MHFFRALRFKFVPDVKVFLKQERTGKDYRAIQKEKNAVDSIIQTTIILNLIMLVTQVKMNRAKVTLLQASDYWGA